MCKSVVADNFVKILHVERKLDCIDALRSSQSFSWTEIYFGHFVQAVHILFGHLEIFRTIFQTLILPP